jgi:hypothetical protein
MACFSRGWLSRRGVQIENEALSHSIFRSRDPGRRPSKVPATPACIPTLREAEYLADEDSVLLPADVAAIVHLSQKETLRVRELQAVV